MSPTLGDAQRGASLRRRCVCDAQTDPACPVHGERFVLDDQAPNNDLYGPARRYGVLDRERGEHAMLPDSTLCWGMTIDRALDSLNELRGGLRAERDYE